MVFSRGRSKSPLRADVARAQLATLRDKLQAMKVSGASATYSTGSMDIPKPKSASSLRADAAEAELAKLREQMTTKKKCLKFTCKIGWCSHAELEQIQRFSVTRSEMERNIAHAEKEIRRKYAKVNTLDLVIVMDCTGSMAPWIEKAKTPIISIIDNVKTDHPKADVRAGFVAYRDFCDGDDRLQVKTLTPNMVAVRNFISSLGAFGGVDGPEEFPGGLAAALEMSFQAEARRIVLVCDAPCHGRKFNGGDDDLRHLAQIKQSPDIRAQMREMKRGFDFTVMEIQPSYTAKMVRTLRQEYHNAESCDGFNREFQKVSLANANDVACFASVICSSASSFISASKERSVVASSKIALGVPDCDARGATGTTKLSHVLEGDDEEEKAPREVVIVAPPVMTPLDWSAVYSSPGIAAVRHSLHFRPGEHADWKDLNLMHTQPNLLCEGCNEVGACTVRLHHE